MAQCAQPAGPREPRSVSSTSWVPPGRRSGRMMSPRRIPLRRSSPPRNPSLPPASCQFVLPISLSAIKFTVRCYNYDVRSNSPWCASWSRRPPPYPPILAACSHGPRASRSRGPGEMSDPINNAQAPRLLVRRVLFHPPGAEDAGTPELFKALHNDFPVTVILNDEVPCQGPLIRITSQPTPEERLETHLKSRAEWGGLPINSASSFC